MNRGRKLKFFKNNYYNQKNPNFMNKSLNHIKIHVKIIAKV
jgi:hypothetical protein